MGVLLMRSGGGFLPPRFTLSILSKGYVLEILILQIFYSPLPRLVCSHDSCSRW